MTVVAVQDRATAQVRAAVIPAADRRSLFPFVLGNALPGARTHTDKARACDISCMARHWFLSRSCLNPKRAPRSRRPPSGVVGMTRVEQHP